MSTQTSKGGPDEGIKQVASAADARRLAMLVKPRRRTPKEALPSALHLSVTAATSMGVAVAVFIAVTVHLPPKHPLRGQIQNACSLACVTVAVIAMPQLGNSVARGIQRISGVMIGGWAFCGLFLALPMWWFQGLCLGAFTFLAVTSSHFFMRQEYMYPPMVVSAFIVCVGFADARAAVTGTIVKTCGIASGILVYTVLSTILFPRTATQEVIDLLVLTMNELRDLADVLLRGRKAGATGAAALSASGSEGAPPDEKVQGSPPGRVSKGSGGLCMYSASTLAATIPLHLRQVQAMLPDTGKEQFLGRLPGGYMCFAPAPLKSRNPPFGADVLAVVHVIHMVHRSLWLMMTPAAINEGAGTGALGSALGQGLPKALEADARGLITDMSNEAVAALQELAAALSHHGTAQVTELRSSHVERYNTLNQDLYRLSLQKQEAQEAAAQCGPRARWQRAIEMQVEVNAAKRGRSGALGQLVGSMMQRGDPESARWCATLLLLQQLGEGLDRLQECMGTMLKSLPGACRHESRVAQPGPGADHV